MLTPHIMLGLVKIEPLKPVHGCSSGMEGVLLFSCLPVRYAQFFLELHLSRPSLDDGFAFLFEILQICLALCKFFEQLDLAVTVSDLQKHMVSNRVLRGKFLAPRPRNAPLPFAPTRTGPKSSKFYGPDPGPTRLYFPRTGPTRLYFSRTGPDRNNIASTRN